MPQLRVQMPQLKRSCGFPAGTVGRDPCASAGDTGLIPGPGRLHMVVVQSLRRVQLFANPWTAVHQTSLSFTISWSLPKLMSTGVSSSHQVAKVLELQLQSFQ